MVYFLSLHSDGLRLIFVACNDLVPWTFLTSDQRKEASTEQCTTRVANNNDIQTSSGKRRCQTPSQFIWLDNETWFPSSQLPPISPWRRITRSKVKDSERKRQRGVSLHKKSWVWYFKEWEKKRGEREREGQGRWRKRGKCVGEMFQFLSIKTKLNINYLKNLFTLYTWPCCVPS